MSGEVVGEGVEGKKCRDPENQFSFIRKTYKQLIFAIVQVVETFLNIRIRFQSDFNHILIMMCDRKVDCCNLSPIPMFYSVSWIAIFSKIMLWNLQLLYIGQLHYLLRYETHKYDEVYN